MARRDCCTNPSDFSSEWISTEISPTVSKPGLCWFSKPFANIGLSSYIQVNFYICLIIVSLWWLFVASLTIKLPDDQKSEIEAVVERKNYNSVSEYVREALRDKVGEDLVLRPEVAEKLQKRVKEYEEAKADRYTLQELDKELGLSDEAWDPRRSLLKTWKAGRTVQKQVRCRIAELRNGPLGQNTSFINKQGLEIFRLKLKTGELDHRVFFDPDGDKVVLLGVEHRDQAYTPESIKKIKSRRWCHKSVSYSLESSSANRLAWFM